MPDTEPDLTSIALSAFHALERKNQTTPRVLIAAGGLLATAVMWFVHLSHPELFLGVLELDSKVFFLLLFGVVVAPPFAVAFSIGSIIFRQAYEPDTEETGLMSGYFYRERANRKWKLAIVAGIVGGINFLLMMITAADS
jgi:hypothetical protein